MDDFQKRAVYDSEYFLRDTMTSLAQVDVPTFDFYGSSLLVPLERKFGDLEGVQRYVNSILALNWVRAMWPEKSILPVKVRARRGTRFAHYEFPGVIAVPPHNGGISWAMREIVILHELSHHFARDQHGPKFASTFLHMVKELMGPEVGLILTDAYTRNGVQFGALTHA
ncbi:TIGR04338 family metallohydrolase [Streptomyces sp. MI02-2A]|uniref:TIGR04338 family metallohydrolase n=1 Tax=Streptomyces sp. MI02-2A TaxID=3028688 RepID=UPI0029B17BEC|nr:TIGR04338 family metallohydrolase [Streptomyces sp. MI02-2A]MDX3260758.1 TIGR04338 family metallohydrolase [Streptomyces sp. MI02-2A]